MPTFFVTISFQKYSPCFPEKWLGGVVYLFPSEHLPTQLFWLSLFPGSKVIGVAMCYIRMTIAQVSLCAIISIGLGHTLWAHQDWRWTRPPWDVADGDYSDNSDCTGFQRKCQYCHLTCSLAAQLPGQPSKVRVFLVFKLVWPKLL